MSGMKEGHFNASLQRLRRNLQRYLELCRGAAVGASIGSGLQKLEDDVRGKLGRLSAPSARAREFATAEVNDLEKQISAASRRLQEVSGQVSAAIAKWRESASQRGDSDAALGEIEKEIEQLRVRVQRKVATTDYMSLMSLALDNEVDTMERLGRSVQARIAVAERGANRSLAQGRDLAAKAEGALRALLATTSSLASRL